MTKLDSKVREVGVVAVEQAGRHKHQHDRQHQRQLVQRQRRAAAPAAREETFMSCAGRTSRARP